MSMPQPYQEAFWKQSDASRSTSGESDARSRRRVTPLKGAVEERRPLRNISSGVRLLIFASQDALRELDDVRTRLQQG